MSAKSLEVTLVRCQGLPKVQLLGKQDPFVILKYEDQESRSQICKDGGTDPNFNEKFVFVIHGKSTVLELSITNDGRSMRGNLIGTAKADFVMALEKGQLRKSFPVFDSKDQPQGTVELFITVPEVLAVRQAEQNLEAMKLAEARDRWSKALSDARAKHAPEVQVGLAPHIAALAPLEKEHWEAVTEVKEGEEEEMEGMLRESMKKAEELISEAAKELASSAVAFKEEAPKAIMEKIPGASTKFSKEIDTLRNLLTQTNEKRAKDVSTAEQILLQGLKQTLARFSAAMASAHEDYEAGFKRAVGHYKGEVKGHLEADAEAKAVAEAMQVANPPPPGLTAVTPSTPPPQARQAPAASAPAAARPAAPSYRAPAYYAPAYYAPPAYHTQPAPPSPYYPPQAAVGRGNSFSRDYPMTQAERAAAEAARAQAEAAAAKEAARKAEADAAALRFQQQQQQQQMNTAIAMSIRERRAARRGVVGGVLLARALR